MAKIEFPKQLKQLLVGSDLEAPIRTLADRVGEILADIKLQFFPDYTDHGIDHVNLVLKSEVELVPKEVWDWCQKDSDQHLLCDADAAVMVGATLLHDIAMHLCPDGFRELVGKDSRFKPLPWFIESHEGHSADRHWHEMWEDYVREARRFSDRDLANIIGEESARAWKFHELPEDAGRWERNHCLVIGEFIRRHHARLAHEIAIYGFPGLPAGSGEHQFPAMGKEEGHSLMRFADLIGMTARSHGMSLRVSKTYLEHQYSGSPRPMGTAALYPMALLRIADYLQIDRQRAPAVLLQLRNPQSPISVLEWQKHRAVQYIGPATDPRGKMVTVSTDLSLSLYLQLRDLLAGLQAEMDHSTAVLDEAYGARTDLGLNQLNLSIRRVYSNLESPAFRDSLPYVPKQTGFTADPNLLTLLVEPLYGKEPSVGVRELMQNAVDAVCELDVWCAAHGKTVESLDLPEQGGDVLIEFIERVDGSWFLRVRDRGIGMTSDTIQNYFLRAGASFRRSKEWAKEFLDERGQPRVTRAGRFGIGAFAVFLLGPSFRLWTRHVSADISMGYMIEASINSQLIEVKRMDAPSIGTMIEVDLSSETVKALNLKEQETKFGKFSTNSPPQIDWYCWDWPKVKKRVVRGLKIKSLGQKYTCPVRKKKLPPDLAVIHPDGFDAVYWAFDNMPKLSCNGLMIANPTNGLTEAGFNWPDETQLKAPRVAIIDSGANLPLTTQRYALSQKTVPFIEMLARDVTLSFIAHALICGPSSRTDAFTLRPEHPLRLKQQDSSRYMDDKFNLRLVEKPLDWCVTSTEMIPADPWLYTLLGTESCTVFGVLSQKGVSLNKFLADENELLEQKTIKADGAIYSHYGIINHDDDNDKIFEEPQDISTLATQMLSDLARLGASNLGCEVVGCRTLVSSNKEFNLESNELMHWEELARDADLVIDTIFGTKEPYSDRRWYEAITGSFTADKSFENVLKPIENVFRDDNEHPHPWRISTVPEFLYVTELLTRKVGSSPETLIAKIWYECLGARAIPFDPAAREALIADGCKHPELKRHIEAWKEMKRTGSKWVTGEKR